MRYTKYILAILAFVCILPASSYAVKLKADKYALLMRALEEKNLAIQELHEAKRIIWYLPDLESQKHMKALIASAVSSLAPSTPYVKVLSVGLSLMSSLAIDSYERFCEMREHLILADYHVEMSNFFRVTSMEFEEKFGFKDSATESYFTSIDYLTLATLSAQCIPNEDGRMIAIDSLDHCMKVLLNRGKNLSLETEGLAENIDEILSESDADEVLRDEIWRYVELCHECMCDADNIWARDKKKKNG